MAKSSTPHTHTCALLLPKGLGLALTCLLCLMPLAAAAQQDEAEYRMEVGAAAGVNFMLNDANSKAYGGMGLAGGAVLRFVLNPRMSVKTALTYDKVSGNVGNVAAFYPGGEGSAATDRLQYEFSGALYDLCATYELNFLPYGYERGYQGYSRITPYIQMGFGLTYSKVGSAFTANIPLGVGVKYKVSKRLNLGLDWTFHFSLSDKLDGLEAPTGIKSELFRNKDHYCHTILTLTYDISPRCPNCNKD